MPNKSKKSSKGPGATFLAEAREESRRRGGLVREQKAAVNNFVKTLKKAGIDAGQFLRGVGTPRSGKA